MFAALAPFIPALIGAGASILGTKMAQDAADDRAAAANQAGREMATHGIRWKVEDAKAAGLHPLFALGGAGATYSPAAAPVFDQSQNLGRAAEALSSGFEKVMRDNALKMSASQLEESDLRKDLLYSQIWRNYHEAAPAVEMMPPAVRPGVVYGQDGSMPGGFVGLEFATQGSPRELRAGGVGRGKGGLPGQGDAWAYETNKVPTSRPSNPGIGAGPGKPMFDDFVLPMSVEWPTEYGTTKIHPRILLPQGASASEAIEALSEGGTSSPMFAAIAAVNIEHYGRDYWNMIVQGVRNSGRVWNPPERGYQRGEKYRRGYRGAY